MSETMQEIKGLIVAKLQGLKNGAGKDLLSEVFGYAQGDMTKYPAACVTPITFTGETIDTHRIERIFTFEIKLYQEQSKAGRTKEEADDIMTEAADIVLRAFDTDYDLTGEIEKVEVVSGAFDFKTQNGTFNFATFQLNCKVVLTNY